MGHCQGDVQNYDCEGRVAAIIARELGVPPADVGVRPWPGSSMMKQRILSDGDSEHLRALSDPTIEYVLHGAA